MLLVVSLVLVQSQAWEIKDEEEAEAMCLSPSSSSSSTRNASLDFMVAILDLTTLLIRGNTSEIRLRAAADKVYELGSMSGQNSLSLREAIEWERIVQQNIANQRRYAETNALFEEQVRISKEADAKCKKDMAEREEWMRQRNERKQREDDDDDQPHRMLQTLLLSIWAAGMCGVAFYSILSFVYRHMLK